MNYKDKWDDPNYVFEYDETSKSCLRWKNHRRFKSYIGKECGCLSEGRWLVSVNNKLKSVHEIVWKMFTDGCVPEKALILPKNGDYKDTRISNLYLSDPIDRNWQNEFLAKGEWGKVFDYKNGVLYWKGSRWGGKFLHIKLSEDGDPIVCKTNKSGYMQMNCTFYKGQSYSVHRVVYEWHNGKIPIGMAIDHINGDTSDNRIENLRCVIPAVNSRNIRVGNQNKSGVLGVRKVYDPKCNHPYWLASWCFNRKERTKSFSLKNYTDDEAFKLACEYRDKMIAKLNQELGDEGYHENHGKR